jgi:ERCC4-type nuclease
MSKTVCVERKRIDDLWASIHDGRFRSQTSRITTHQSDKVVMYLIAGSIDEFIYTEYKRGVIIDENVLHGAIASLLVRDNIRVLYCTNEKNGLKQMVRFIQKIEEEDILNYPASRDCDMLFSRILNISKNMWFDIKEKYGTSLCHLCSLSEKDFMKVKGIGKVKAKTLVNLLKHGW